MPNTRVSRASGRQADEHSERNASKDAPSSYEQHGPDDIASLSAQCETHRQFLASLRHVETDQAEQTDGRQRHGQSGEDCEGRG
jgi:hypothetical protein